jgi:hypothetical protein
MKKGQAWFAEKQFIKSTLIDTPSNWTTLVLWKYYSQTKNSSQIPSL